MVIDQYLQNTVSVKYFTDWILGSFGNLPVIERNISVIYFTEWILGSFGNEPVPTEDSFC